MREERERRRTFVQFERCGGSGRGRRGSGGSVVVDVFEDVLCCDGSLVVSG